MSPDGCHDAFFSPGGDVSVNFGPSPLSRLPSPSGVFKIPGLVE